LTLCFFKIFLVPFCSGKGALMRRQLEDEEAHDPSQRAAGRAGMPRVNVTTHGFGKYGHIIADVTPNGW
jgi:hypothetical protein